MKHVPDKTILTRTIHNSIHKLEVQSCDTFKGNRNTLNVENHTVVSLLTLRVKVRSWCSLITPIYPGLLTKC